MVTTTTTGTPRDVYDTPANDFVMGFLGPAVRIDGALMRPHDLRIALQTDGILGVA